MNHQKEGVKLLSIFNSLGEFNSYSIYIFSKVFFCCMKEREIKYDSILKLAHSALSFDYFIQNNFHNYLKNMEYEE